LGRLVIKLDPATMSNPDLDIRYSLPDLLIERSNGNLKDDGFDYDHSKPKPALLLFMTTNDLEADLSVVIDVIEHVRVLENELQRVAVVAVERASGASEVVYPQAGQGQFLALLSH
jgi:hypothetical protein